MPHIPLILMAWMASVELTSLSTQEALPPCEKTPESMVQAVAETLRHLRTACPTCWLVLSRRPASVISAPTVPSCLLSVPLSLSAAPSGIPFHSHPFTTICDHMKHT